MKRMRSYILLALWIAFGIAQANTIVPAGTMIGVNQSISSGNGRYRLVQQSDGNLVFYRSDGAVRFATYQYGNYAVMQHDGNFVQYNSSHQPVFATHTNSPGAFLRVQDDGNLVVYSAGGVPLWNIGGDPDNDRPSAVGDVAARDLESAIPGANYFGHTAVYLGNSLFESNVGGSNALRYVSWDSYKSKGKYWGTARPNIPSHNVQYCFATYCSAFSTPPLTRARYAIALRAQQLYAIGASYTVSTEYSYVIPASEFGPAQRGAYRCDTVVLDIFMNTADIGSGNATIPIAYAWNERMRKLHDSTIRLPHYIWTALKN